MLGFSYIVALIVCLYVTGAEAAVSVAYLANADHPQIVNGNFVSNAQFSATQIADMYNRLSGIPPLLREENENLPSIDSLSSIKAQPILLEVHGSALPSHVAPVLSTHHEVIQKDASVPSASSVLEILSKHGVKANVEVYKTSENNPVPLSAWLTEHTRTQPAVILHYTTPVVNAGAEKKRHLGTKPSTTTAASTNNKHTLKHHKKGSAEIAEPTEFEISQYQICLWTAVGFVLILLASIGSITNMEVLPDSLLYAKFQSGRTGRSD